MAGRLAVVIGGGTVGRRKAAGLLQAGATVRVVSLDPRPVEENSAQLDWVQSSYQEEHLNGAALVFAAATAEVNRRVIAGARERGIWVCSATEPADGDFLTAAVIRRGDLTVALGTGGAVPALTRAIRRRLEGVLDTDVGIWLRLLAELRPLVLEAVKDAGQRNLVWEQLCDDSWLQRLRTDGEERVCEALHRLVVGMADDSAPPL